MYNKIRLEVNFFEDIYQSMMLSLASCTMGQVIFPMLNEITTLSFLLVYNHLKSNRENRVQLGFVPTTDFPGQQGCGNVDICRINSNAYQWYFLKFLSTQYPPVIWMVWRDDNLSGPTNLAFFYIYMYFFYAVAISSFLNFIISQRT